MDEQNVVQVRVQVIDMKSFTLDLQVPTYLPARDLTQRVARDAGLDSHWDDGRRRLYWLRARGRLMGDDEKLSDLGVVNGELVYLLLEPPAGSGVVEQGPDYPETHGYAGAGTLVLLGS
ncbi:MAG: EsaB/YukD family protein, partial [Myxococcota bacterium]